jgi:hypothetical protein
MKLIGGQKLRELGSDRHARWNYCKTCVTAKDGTKISCAALKENGVGCDWHNTPEHCKMTDRSQI